MDELCHGTEIISATSIVASTLQYLSDNKSCFILATHIHKLCTLELVRDLIASRKSQYSFDEEKALMFLHKSDDMLKMIDQQPINSDDNDDTELKDIPNLLGRNDKFFQIDLVEKMRVNIKTEMGCPMKFYLKRKTNVGLMKKLISKKCESHSGFLCQ